MRKNGKAKKEFSASRVILVDFDGCIAPFRWPGKIGAPFPGALEALRELKDRGYTIIIFTARAWEGWKEIQGVKFFREQMDQMVEWLERWKVPYDKITNEKAPAEWMIDDRAIPVRGNEPGEWASILKFILDRAGDTYGRVQETEKGIQGKIKIGRD